MFSTHIRHRTVTVLSVAALTIGAATVSIGDAHAAPALAPRFQLAATALKPAIRLSQSGVIMFPMNPLPKCSLSKTSFGQPRPNGRTHEGIDLMASLGQEVYAVDNGVLTRQAVDGATNATLSGNAWTLTMPDKTYYFYGHLSKFADGLAETSRTNAPIMRSCSRFRTACILFFSTE